jgi:hypothetical protein
MWCPKQTYKSYKEMTKEYKDEIHLNDGYIQLNYVCIFLLILEVFVLSKLCFKKLSILGQNNTPSVPF